MLPLDIVLMQQSSPNVSLQVEHSFSATIPLLQKLGSDPWYQHRRVICVGKTMTSSSIISLLTFVQEIQFVPKSFGNMKGVPEIKHNSEILFLLCLSCWSSDVQSSCVYLHNNPSNIWDRHKNFKDPTTRSWDIVKRRFQSYGFLMFSIYKPN